MRCSCSGLSTGDCAPFVPRFPPRIAPRGFLGACPCGGCTQRAAKCLDSPSPAAPHGTLGRRIVRPRTRRAPLADATTTHDCTSAGLAPVHLDPPLPFRAVALGRRASVGQSRLSNFCNETTAYEHIRARRVRARLRPRAPCEADDRLAFAQRLPSRSTPLAARRGSTTQGGFAEDRRRLATPAEVQPRTGRPGVKGPQPFGLFADLPPPKPAEHPFVASALPPEPGVLRSRLTWPIAPGFPG